MITMFSRSSSAILPSDIKLKGQTGFVFSNWSKTFSCKPERFFMPSSIEEIQEIVRIAREKNKKVKVVGCGHSPSDLACTDEYMISLCHFNRLLEVDEKNLTIKVEGGITLAELNHNHLPRLGLALSVTGSVSDLTLVGAISTGTHGSGIKYGILSTNVVALEILTSESKIIEVTRAKNEELFLACCCGLGAFGIIISVTFQCEKAFRLELNQYPCSMKQVLENLDVHLKSSEHFRFMWFPHTENVMVSHVSRTEQEISSPSWLSQWTSWIKNYLIGYHALEFCYWVSTFVPQIIPTLNRMYFYILNYSPVHQVDRSDKIFNFDCLFQQYVNEWAIPIENTAVVLYELQEWFSEDEDFYAHFPVEVRFVKGDDILISPAFGRDTCYINIIMYRPYGKFVPYERYWAAYERIMKKFGGRPHWAKAHKETSRDLKKMYSKFSEWCQLRKQIDPIDMFVNGYLERIL